MPTGAGPASGGVEPGGPDRAADAEPSGDGRSARRRRNRDRVIDALVELTEEGVEDPSVDVIAQRAGVSYRSVYRYFTDRSEMLGVATERALEWLRPAMVGASGPITPDESLEARIAAIVAARLDAHELVGEGLRSTTRRSFSNRVVHATLVDVRRTSREQIVERFGAELDRFGAGERELRLSAIDQALGLQAIDYLVDERGHGRRQVEALLRGIVRCALAAPEVGG